jgi:Na+(H+)/acetate symporter ActP
MRRVEFPLADRVVLAPVELVMAFPLLLAAIVLGFLAGTVAALAAVATILAGTVLFPILLPFIPTRDFSTKGAILGVIVALPFVYAFGTNPSLPAWAAGLSALTVLLVTPAVVSYLALNLPAARRSRHGPA